MNYYESWSDIPKGLKGNYKLYIQTKGLDFVFEGHPIVIHNPMTEKGFKRYTEQLFEAFKRKEFGYYNYQGGDVPNFMSGELFIVISINDDSERFSLATYKIPLKLNPHKLNLGYYELL